MKNTSSSSSASSSSTFSDLSLSCSLASPSVTLFPPSALGAVRDEHKTGESVSCGEPQTKITGTFFIKTHVHPPTHKVTHVCADTHTHRDRGPFYLRIPGERCSCSWVYFGHPSKDCVCWYPALEMDLHRQWKRALYGYSWAKKFKLFFNCLDLKL